VRLRHVAAGCSKKMKLTSGSKLVALQTILVKMSIDLPDDLAIKIDIQFYSDTRDALLKAIVE